MGITRSLFRRFVPSSIRRRLTRLAVHPPVGSVDFGDLRVTRPISTNWGYDRGTPIDRHYIERFLEAHARDIRGRALEVKDDTYVSRFGVAVESVDTLLPHREGSATVVADLTRPEQLPADTYDCFVCTQVLQFIDDVAAAIAGCRRVLRPGGVLLVTVPAISRTEGAPEDSSGDYWRFTPRSAERLFGADFGPDAVRVSLYGNVLSATAFLHGLAAEELTAAELDLADPEFPVIVGIRAQVGPESANP
ncbi:MAG: methyltransferase domain-containing protein [Gemmatimonadota bacterium]